MNAKAASQTLVQPLILLALATMGVALFTVAPTPEPNPENANPVLARQVQTELAHLGFDPGPVDGLPGAQTRRAIQLFRVWSGNAGNEGITPELLLALRQKP